MEEWIASETIHTGPVFSVESGKARLDDGSVAVREVVRHRGGAAVVPVMDGRVFLVRQYRIAVEGEVVELAAGIIDPGEDAETAARRELKEELGFEAERLVPVSRYYSSVGYLDESVRIFLAFGLKRVDRSPEPEERIEVVSELLADLPRKLAERHFDDAKTIIGLYDLLAYLAGQGEGLMMNDER